MIVAEKVLDVQVSGITSKKFGIALNRKMFRILSADLYSDKIRAVIRELSTNAADAHVAAGKTDKPFEVHLPNRMEPYFMVKDYGTGLTEQAIANVYTQYGVSDKTNSNEYTGCLGLGSKSPFAYTDSFTVESRRDGFVTCYTAYLDGEGFPALSDPLTVTETDEPNGLTVKFPVQEKDFINFVDKACNVLKWFKVRPTVTGSSQFQYPPVSEYIRKTDSYALVKRDRYGYGSSRQSYVVMGNVAYPINTDQIADYYARGDVQKVRQLLEWGVELYVKIGDVDITASREALSYDDDELSEKRTVPFIKKACLAAIKDLETEVTKDIGNKPTLWAARETLYEIRKEFPGLDIGGTWNGQSVETKVQVPADKAIVERISRKGMRQDRLTVTKTNVSEIAADGSTIFINDGRGGYAAVRRYLADKKDGEHVFLVNEGADATWLAATGIDKVIMKTSTLPKAERIPGAARGSAQKAKLYEFCGNSRRGASAADYWKAAEFDVEDDGEFVYVEILYFNYRPKPGEDHTNNPSDLINLLDAVKAVSGKALTIYGLRPSDKAIIEKSEGTWIPLHEYAEKVQKEAGVTLHAGALLAKQYEDLGRHALERLERFKFGSTGLAADFIKKLRVAGASRANQKVKDYAYLCRLLNVTIDAGNDLSLENDKVYARYPMLRYVNDWISSDAFKNDCAEYIRLVDAQSDGEL